MNNSINRIKTNISIINRNPSSNNQFYRNKGDVIFKERSNFVTEIILDNPNSLNSMTLNMVKSILSSFGNWLSTADKDLVSGINLDINFATKIPKVILMAGNGKKAFCAGGDVVSLYFAMKEKVDLNMVGEFFKLEFLADLVVSRMIPTQISIWDGIVMGGGVGISINAPIRIATENTIFAMPETRIGLFPDVGSTYFLPRIFNKNIHLGLYVGLIGEKIKGKELVKCGLATHYIPSSQINSLKSKIVEATNNKTTVQDIINICNTFSVEIYDPNNFSYPNLDIINKVFLDDSLKNNLARLRDLSKERLNRKEEERIWAKNTLEKLCSFSPISLFVHFEQFKYGMGNITLKDAYELELKLIYKFIERNEFMEGIRAALVEKDNKPVWKYKTVDEVDEKELIHEYFS